jgi:hypothetical protein
VGVDDGEEDAQKDRFKSDKEGENFKQKGHDGEDSAQGRDAGARARKPIPKASESLSQRVAAAFHTIVDTLSDAEQLHRKLDPGVSREPE